MNPGAAAWTRRPFARSADTRRPAAVARTEARTITIAAAIGVAAIGLRVLFAPQFDGLDDAGYLEAAQRVSEGRPLDQLFALFRTRVGMAYPLGWLLQAGWLRPDQFWILTTIAEGVTLASLFAAGWLLSGVMAAGLAASALYAIYPLAVQQSAMFYPTAFQVASIALACALVALAERIRARGSAIPAFLAGVSLGLGYLCKEDVAITVPAIVLAAAIARYPRLRTAALVCAGAALIFAIECVAYWQFTGHPLFRLAATSGLGAPVGAELRIAEIWRWDAYLASLWLMPLHVGVMWWLAIPALWAAVRWRDQRGVAFAAVLFVIVMAYLQFGSGSLGSYSPLPKTPRYTALGTPLLMLITGTWLARLHASSSSRAIAVGAVVAMAAVPCLVYLHITSSERTRNTLAVLPVLAHLPPQPLYTDYYSARVLRLLDPAGGDVRVWYHARFDERAMAVLADPSAGGPSYVLLDRQAAKVYTSSYEMPLPEGVSAPPASWTVVWTHHAYPEGSLGRSLLEGLRAAAARLPGGNSLSRRIERGVAGIIDGDQATLYRAGY